MWVCFWAVSFVPLVYASVFVPVPYCFDWCSWSQLVWTSSFVLSSHDCFFQTKCRIICSSSIKNVMIILIQIALNLLIALCNMHILTLLISPTHEHKKDFHFFLSSSIPFINIFSFSEYRSFTSLVKFIPRYFLLFHMMYVGLIFLFCFHFLIAYY